MRLLIAGAGGHGRVVADAAVATGKYSAVAFVDDRDSGRITSEGWPIVGPLEKLENLTLEFEAFVVAVGDAALRLALQGRAKGLGFSCEPILHPSSTISKHSSIGDGSVVIAGACVNVGARIGPCCIVNTGATVDHDCVLSEGVHVSPGAHLAGGVVVGPLSWVGIGAAVRQGIRIGAGVTIGAGAVVVKDIPDGATAIGNPAHVVALPSVNGGT